MTTKKTREDVIRRFKARAFCDECGKTILQTPVYMVHRHVWACEAGMPAKGYLHIDCLQGRVGRPLTADDFTPAPCNILVVWALNKSSEAVKPKTIQQKTDTELKYMVEDGCRVREARAELIRRSDKKHPQDYLGVEL